MIACWTTTLNLFTIIPIPLILLAPHLTEGKVPLRLPNNLLQPPRNIPNLSLLMITPVLEIKPDTISLSQLNGVTRVDVHAFVVVQDGCWVVIVEGGGGESVDHLGPVETGGFEGK